MDNKREIEEMAQVIAASRLCRCIKSCPDCSLDGACMWQEIANALYAEDYRKHKDMNKPSSEDIKHGCWMYGETDNPFVVEIYCPWCGKPALYPSEEEDDGCRPLETEYCPHCGVVMDAESADPSWPFYEISLKQKNIKETHKGNFNEGKRAAE